MADAIRLWHMFEQFFLGLALIGCLVLVYRRLRLPRAAQPTGNCQRTSCHCGETDDFPPSTRRENKGI
jgi:hypothetical protein